MAVKFLVLDEAARVLGIAPEELNKLRLRQEVSAYRDGATWKFKSADIERLARERGNRAGQSDDDLGVGDIDNDLSLSLDDEPSKSAAGPAPAPVAGDSDELGLSLDDDLGLPAEAPLSSDLEASDDLSLSADDDLSLRSDNDLTLAADEIKRGGDELGELSLSSDDDLALGEDDEPGLAPTAPAGMPPTASSVATDDSFELAPGGARSVAEEADPYAALAAAGDEELSLGDDLSLSDDIALGDDEMLGLADTPKSKSDELTLNTGDSDIELLSDAESAELKLGGDDPLGLDDADALSADLDEDQLILSDDSKSVEGELTPLSSAEDFQLTPFSEVEGEPSESGSQVIALDSGEDFSEMGGAMAATGGPAMSSMLEEDMGAGPVGGLAAGGLQPTGAGAAAALAGEAPWGGLEMTFLILGALLLLLTGMMMFDLMRNLGAWGAPMSVNKTLMDTILNTLGM
jgi:hypothetical protein